MKKIKKILYTFLFIILNIHSSFAVWDTTIREWLLKQDWKILKNVDYVDKNLSMLDVVLKYIKDSLNGLLMITVVWVFLYLWIKLVLARWNPEEFKKTMMHFVYVAIWIFTVSVAYAIVKMVSWINLF